METRSVHFDEIIRRRGYKRCKKQDNPYLSSSKYLIEQMIQLGLKSFCHSLRIKYQNRRVVEDYAKSTAYYIYFVPEIALNK